jgi:hypothetical protein
MYIEQTAALHRRVGRSDLLPSKCQEFRQVQCVGGQGNILLTTNMEQGNAIIRYNGGDCLNVTNMDAANFLFSKVGLPVL